MKISVNWLKTLVKTDLPTNEICDLLTSSGLEVEGVEKYESIKGGLKGFVVGQVVEFGKHPDADRLSLTKVDIGSGELLSIVCGAPNVVANQKVIVATVGTRIYSKNGESFEIKKSKIRGAVSEGMICAEDEIGIGESHEGILILPDDTKIGTQASEYFNVESDEILEIGLTPNRGDAASHLGVARELAALLNVRLNTKTEIEIKGIQNLPDATNLNTVDVQIKNTEACKRYSGLVISGVNVKASPDWLQHSLKSIGLKPINNIVDVTNFVMHELGQPLHAFDTDKISGKKIIVRNALESEKFVTLDGIERTLNEKDLVIANEKNAMCIAGVFGGSESGISENTTSIFLESAFFDSASTRQSSKHHTLKTDASFRFERGTDPEMTITALHRAAHLIFELAGGILSMNVKDVYPVKLEPARVAFSYNNCNELIGKEIDRGVIKKILTELGIEIETEGNDALLLRVPCRKSDVTREADVIEEVLRIYGQNNIEASKQISFSVPQLGKNYALEFEEKSSRALIGLGFSEMMNLSLSKENYYPNENTIKVVNPLSSDLNTLRANLLFGGLETIAYNSNRKNQDLKFFEFGKTYHHSSPEKNSYIEKKELALFVTGNVFEENPYNLKNKSDFKFLKSAAEAVLLRCGINNFNLSEIENSHFEYGASYFSGKDELAIIGCIKKSLLKEFDISNDVFYANLNCAMIEKEMSKHKIVFEELNKFPTVRRNLALLLDKKIKFSEVESLAFSLERKYLKHVSLFDIYEDEKLGKKKSYAVGFTLENKESTLTDKQIDDIMEKLMKGCKDKLGAEIR